MDEGDMFWKLPARVETAHRRIRCASPPVKARPIMQPHHAQECPDAARFRKAVRSLVGDRRSANLIDPLTVRVDGCTVRLVASPILRDCLEPHSAALGRAAVQVLGEGATCLFVTVQDRRAA